jgi:hypothetical protein
MSKVKLRSKRETNEELVRRLMTYSRFGALSQVFIMEAIARYAEQCATAKPELFDGPLLNGAAWVGVAKEIDHAFKMRMAEDSAPYKPETLDELDPHYE